MKAAKHIATAIATGVALMGVTLLAATNPAPRTLQALLRLGAVVRRTDRDGTVAVVGPADRLRVVKGPR